MAAEELVLFVQRALSIDLPDTLGEMNKQLVPNVVPKGLVQYYDSPEP